MPWFKLNIKVIIPVIVHSEMGLAILEAFYVQGSARAIYCTCFLPDGSRRENNGLSYEKQ